MAKPRLLGVNQSKVPVLVPLWEKKDALTVRIFPRSLRVFFSFFLHHDSRFLAIHISFFPSHILIFCRQTKRSASFLIASVPEKNLNSCVNRLSSSHNNIDILLTTSAILCSLTERFVNRDVIHFIAFYFENSLKRSFY